MATVEPTAEQVKQAAARIRAILADHTGPELKEVLVADAHMIGSLVMREDHNEESYSIFSACKKEVDRHTALGKEARLKRLRGWIAASDLLHLLKVANV